MYLYQYNYFFRWIAFWWKHSEARKNLKYHFSYWTGTLVDFVLVLMKCQSFIMSCKHWLPRIAFLILSEGKIWIWRSKRVFPIFLTLSFFLTRYFSLTWHFPIKSNLSSVNFAEIGNNFVLVFWGNKYLLRHC
jgi:hypothetical protein